MKKRITLLLCTVLLLGALAGCYKNDSTTSSDYTDRFYYLEDTNGGTSYNKIIVDKETGVMYLYHKAGYGGGLTVMLDPDGKPLIYEGEY